MKIQGFPVKKKIRLWKKLPTLVTDYPNLAVAIEIADKYDFKMTI